MSWRATTCATSRCGSVPRPASARFRRPGPFVKSALDVLRSWERVVDGHDIVVTGGDELTSLPALITAPLDPVRFGAADRALERAGIPLAVWDAAGRGDAAVRGAGFDGVNTGGALRPRRADGCRVPRRSPSSAATRGSWLVRGTSIVGSPLTPDATNFPVRAVSSSRGSAPFWPSGSLASRVRCSRVEPGARRPASAMGGRYRRRSMANARRSPGRPRGAVARRHGISSRATGGAWARWSSTAAPAESQLEQYTASELSDRIARGTRALVAPRCVGLVVDGVSRRGATLAASRRRCSWRSCLLGDRGDSRSARARDGVA